MRITIVVISIHNNEILAEVIGRNSGQCSRLIVVSVPDDDGCRDICAKYGAEFHVPAFVSESEPGYHAVYRKIRYQLSGIEAALSGLTPDQLENEWIILLDSDILLPRLFRGFLRERINDLRKDCLYGVNARRNVSTLSQFRALASRSPWSLDGAELQGRIMGFFSLFHASSADALRRLRSDGIAYDDELLRQAFGDANNVTLPLTVLHHAPRIAEWAGRSYLPSSNAPRIRSRSQAGVCDLLPQKQIGRLLVIGRVTRRELALFPEGTQFIRFDDQDQSPDLNGRFEESSHRKPTDLASLLYATVPTTVFIAGEPSIGRMLHIVPALVKSGLPLVVCGGYYGYPAFPPTTAAIELIVGSPDEIFGQGYWSKAIAEGGKHTGSTPASGPPLRQAPVALQPEHRIDEGVVIAVTSPSEEEAAITMLLDIRSRWRGSISIVSWRLDFPSLRIAAAYHQSAYFIASLGGLSLGRAEPDQPTGSEFAALSSCASCLSACAWLTWAQQLPYHKTILLSPSSEIDGFFPERAFARLSNSTDCLRYFQHDRLLFPILLFRADSQNLRDCRETLKRNLANGDLAPAKLCRNMIESWPAITEVEVIAASASTARSLSPALLPSVTVRSPYPISLISYCDAISDAMVVERWASVKLRGVTDLFVIGEKIWHRASTEPGEFNTRPQDEISNAVALDILNPLLRALCAAVEATESEWVALIDGALSPLPGATFPRVDMNTTVIVSPCPQFVLRDRVLSRVPRLNAPGVLFNRGWLRDQLPSIFNNALHACADNPDRSYDFVEALQNAVCQTDKKIAYNNLLDYGWIY